MAGNRRVPSRYSGPRTSDSILSDVRWTSISQKRLITALAVVLLLALSFSVFVLFCTPSASSRRPPSAALEVSWDGSPSGADLPGEGVPRKSGRLTLATLGNVARVLPRDAVPSVEYQAYWQATLRNTKDLWCTYDGRSSFFTVRDLPLQLCRRVVHCCVTLLSPEGQPGGLYDFGRFVALKRSPVHKPQLFVGLGGPHQDGTIFKSLYKDDNATSRLARNVVRFVSSNDLDGAFFYATFGGDAAFYVFSELHRALTSQGLLAAVTIPSLEPVTRYIQENRFPIVRLPPVLSRRWNVGCPVGIEPRIDPDGLVMKSVRFAGVKYGLVSEEVAEEDAPGTLFGPASYAEVCTAIRRMGWKGFPAQRGDCIVAHDGKHWMASITPWSESLAKVANASGVGVVILDMEMDDVYGVCGHDFPLTRAVHSLL